MSRIKVIVDTDPAIGYAFRDVDDALALLHLLALPVEFEVLSVTRVFDNALLPRTVAGAEEGLRVAKRTDVQVHPGVSGRNRLSTPTPVSDFLCGFLPWDVMAAVFLRRPELFREGRSVGACLRRGCFATGAIKYDPSRDDRPSTVPLLLDADAALDDFLAVIGDGIAS